MARRVPGARALMEQAAVALYAERAGTGAGEPTAAEIAERAGVTERTFFRHFPDKLDAFFGDEGRLREQVVEAVAAAPARCSALQAAVLALREHAGRFTENRAALLRRAAIVAAHPGLRERELGRYSAWTDAIAGALAGRGVEPADARRAALVALATFRAAYEEWSAGQGHEPLECVLDETVAAIGEELRAQ